MLIKSFHCHCHCHCHYVYCIDCFDILCQKSASFATPTDQSKAKDTKSTSSASHRTSFLVCGDSHKLFYCKTFKSMSPDERMNVVTEHKLCINCLLSNHTINDCNKSC